MTQPGGLPDHTIDDPPAKRPKGGQIFLYLKPESSYPATRTPAIPSRHRPTRAEMPNCGVPCQSNCNTSLQHPNEIPAAITPELKECNTAPRTLGDSHLGNSFFLNLNFSARGDRIAPIPSAESLIISDHSIPIGLKWHMGDVCGLANW